MEAVCEAVPSLGLSGMATGVRGDRPTAETRARHVGEQPGGHGLRAAGARRHGVGRPRKCGGEVRREGGGDGGGWWRRRAELGRRRKNTESGRNLSGSALSLRFRGRKQTRILREYFTVEPTQPSCLPSKHCEGWVGSVRVGSNHRTKQTVSLITPLD